MVSIATEMGANFAQKMQFEGRAAQKHPNYTMMGRG
jgi:hypothetical protein